MVFEKIKNALFGGWEEGGEKKGERKEVLLKKARKIAEERRENSVKNEKEDIRPLLEKISNVKNRIEVISDELKDADPSEQVHPNIYKSAQDAQRLLVGKVTKASGKIETPSELRWESILNFNGNLQDANNLLRNAIASHGNQVGMVFGDKLDKLKLFSDRLQSLTRKLNSSLRETDRKLKDYDDFFATTSSKEDLEGKRRDLQESLEDLRREKREIIKNVEKSENSVQSLKKSDRYRELKEDMSKREKLENRKDRIRKKINSLISSLDRPLRKMDKMVERDEHMTNKDVLDALSSYLEEPVKATFSEEEGLPKFRKMLRELEAVLEEKMKLDEKERKRRLEEVRDILDKETIRNLRKKFEETQDTLKELERKVDSSSLLDKKERLEKSIEGEKSELEDIDERISSKEDELAEVKKSLKKSKEKVREKGKELLDIEIKI